MSKGRIEFTIARGKPVEVEVSGVAGPECRRVTERYLAALGGRVVATEDKPEIELTPGTAVDVGVGRRG